MSVRHTPLVAAAIVFLGCVVCVSALYNPLEDAYDKYSLHTRYHQIGAHTCETDAAVTSIQCYVSKENKYVMGLRLGYQHADHKDICSTDADLHDTVTVNAAPGEVFVGVKICKGGLGGIKKLLLIKDTGAVEVCGNTDDSMVAHNYDWSKYGSKKAYLEGAAKFHGGRAFLGMRGKAKEHTTCTWLVPKVQPQWAKQYKGKPWMAHNVADRASYTVNGKQYSKLTWTGPYSVADKAYHLDDDHYYDGYFKQVHPLSDLNGMCSNKDHGALWNVLGTFNKCYHPDEHHLNIVEVTLTATLEDDVTCADAEHSQGVLFDLIEAGVHSAASTKHVSTVHDFSCNDVDGTTSITATVMPYGDVSSEQLFDRLTHLSSSDICEADIGQHPKLRAFCNFSFDRHIEITHHNTQPEEQDQQ